MAGNKATGIAVSLIMGLLVFDVAEAAERPNFFRVRQGYATGNAKNGVAKVHSQVDRNGPLGMAGPIALYQVARLARASGMTHFVVVKRSCGTLMINNIRSSDMCDVKARFGSDAVSGDLSAPMSASEVMQSFEENEAYWRPY